MLEDATARLATLDAWSKELGITTAILQQRLQGVSSIIGLHEKQLTDFYREDDVRRVCADLIESQR